LSTVHLAYLKFYQRNIILTEPVGTMFNLSHLPTVQFMSREDFPLLELIESP